MRQKHCSTERKHLCKNHTKDPLTLTILYNVVSEFGDKQGTISIKQVHSDRCIKIRVQIQVFRYKKKEFNEASTPLYLHSVSPIHVRIFCYVIRLNIIGTINECFIVVD